ncbi:MAG: (2Fe-2S) ferredoxin domain-containing protein [Bacillota bacterium]|jgi:NADH:ubiquinone oxidoreductase subunit E|nr:(2Fe-2S) ferredoxin domain-containing protein [Candidatus Fermentithermobacillaceae bacterium]
MVEIEVCVGSSCFLRGSEEVVKAFQQLIEDKCPGKAVLKGSFCMGQCTAGVTIKIQGRQFSCVTPEDVPALFEEHILPYIGG